ncbi:radical SAM protein [Candidatus Dependentiae bacterium]|nr:radical SAM protein [Candidatus Dependentiae bacterium]
MRILLLNLPFNKTVIRRYQCSFNSHNFLFPPLELLYIAGSLKKEGYKDVTLLDCIPEKINRKNLLKLISGINPDFIITQPGFEIFQYDIETITLLKKTFQTSKIILFGYYPSLFYKYIIKHSDIDYVVCGEPEYRIISILKNERNYNGIIDKNNFDEIIVDYSKLDRISDLENQPYPDYELINIKYYSEPFAPKPYISMYTSRGCAFTCTYCIHSFGNNYYEMPAPAAFKKIEYFVNRYNPGTIRFMDDNFTTNKQRIIDICDLIINKKLRFQWSCLSRIDCLDETLIKKMSEAGCKRIYTGIETLDKSTQAVFNKKIDIQKTNEVLKLMKINGIESFSFFIIDYDSYENIKKKINEFLKLKLDLMSVCKLIPYPGTVLFNKFRNEIDFSLYPYKNIFKNSNYEKYSVNLEFYLLLRFYIRPLNMLKIFARMFYYPAQTFSFIFRFFKYILFKSFYKEDFI